MVSERHEEGGEDAVPAVALQPAHDGLQGDGEDDADEHPEQDGADLEEEEDEADDDEHRQVDDGGEADEVRCARVAQVAAWCAS